MDLSRIPIDHEDPEYQEIREYLRNQSDQELERILQEFGPEVSGREEDKSSIAGLGVISLFLYLMGVPYTGAATISAFAFLLGCEIYTGTKRRKIEKYGTITADTILSERREHQQVF